MQLVVFVGMDMFKYNRIRFFVILYFFSASRNKNHAGSLGNINQLYELCSNPSYWIEKERKVIPVNEDSNESVGIYVEGGSNNYIGENTIKGFKKGIVLKDTEANTVINNEMLTEEAATIFHKLDLDIESLEIEAQKKHELSSLVTNMKVGFGSGTFTDAYKEFSSFLSNHVTIMTPIMPYLALFAEHLR